MKIKILVILTLLITGNIVNVDASSLDSKLTTHLTVSSERSANTYTNYVSDVAQIELDLVSGLISIDEAVGLEKELHTELINGYDSLDNQKMIETFTENFDMKSGEYSPNKQERELCFGINDSNAVKCSVAYSDANYAGDRSYDNWMTYTQWEGNGDAYRHALWNALMSKDLGNDFAYKLSLAHEGLEVGYDFDSESAEVKMDMHNNRFGREYYTDRKNLNMSDYDISFNMYYQIYHNSTSLSSGIRPRRIRTLTYDYTTQSSCNNADSGDFYSWQGGYCTKWVGWFQDTTSGGGRYKAY